MNSLGRDFAAIYGRELDRLVAEIEAYRREEDLWTTQGRQKNPPGVLALHVVGGLMAMIGAALGGMPYVRDRDREFAGRGVPRDEIVRRIRECRVAVVSILEGTDDATMRAAYPGQLPATLRDATTQALVAHLLWHLGWHLGHVYYHRLGLADTGAP